MSTAAMAVLTAAMLLLVVGEASWLPRWPVTPPAPAPGVAGGVTLRIERHQVCIYVYIYFLPLMLYPVFSFSFNEGSNFFVFFSSPSTHLTPPANANA